MPNTMTTSEQTQALKSDLVKILRKHHAELVSITVCMTDEDSVPFWVEIDGEGETGWGLTSVCGMIEPQKRDRGA